MNGRSPPPPAAANSRAWSTIASRFAAPWSPSGRVSANSTRRVRSTTRRTISASESRVRIRCRSRSSASASLTAAIGPCGRGAVGQRAGLGAVADEALVVDRERARAQRADEREPVGRVVDRGEHPDQVADLLALEEVARALVPVGDSGVGERLLVVLEPGARRHQDRHVAPPARPPAVRRRGGRGSPTARACAVCSSAGDRARLLARGAHRRCPRSSSPRARARSAAASRSARPGGSSSSTLPGCTPGSALEDRCRTRR